MKLFLVRHGQTDWNLAQRFQGQSDLALNPTGLRQSAALADRLQAQSIDLVYSSDLQRARSTAATIAARHTCELRVDSRLREINFGQWEGLTYDEIKLSTPAALAAWEANFITTAPPGGETLQQLSARVASVLDALRAQPADKTLLVVAHGGPLQILLCLALNISPASYWQFHLAPASLSEIGFYPAGAMLNLLNDTCHLEGIRWES